MFKIFLFSLLSVFVTAGPSFALDDAALAKSQKSFSSASPANVDQELKNLAAEHYLDQTVLQQIHGLLTGDFSTLRRRPIDFAKPGGQDRCQSMICTTLGESHCRFQPDRDQAKLLCANQYDETCMQNWCTIQIGSPCRFMSDFDEAAQVCGEVGGPCLKSVCDRLGPNACRMSSDLKVVASICRGFYDSACIDAVCEKRSEHECKQTSRLKEIATACTLEQNPWAEEVE